MMRTSNRSLKPRSFDLRCWTATCPTTLSSDIRTWPIWKTNWGRNMQSTLKALLQSNDAPSDTESALIRQHLATLKQMVNDVEIARLEHSALGVVLPGSADLHLQYDTLQEQIQTYRALLTPLRGLPEDILREIFTHCLPSSHNSTIMPTQAPLVLAHVCRRWRDVIFTVWSSIHIPLPASPSLITFGEQWLVRTGSLPLSVSFSSVKPKFGSTIPYLTWWFSKLQPFSHRLNNVSFSLTGNSDQITNFMENQYLYRGFDQIPKVAIRIGVFDPYNRQHFANILPSLGIHQNSRLCELRLSMNFHILTLPDCFDRAIPWRNIKLLNLQTQNFFRFLPNIVRNGVLLRILSRCFKITQLNAFSGGALRVFNNNEEIPEMVTNTELQHATLFFIDFMSPDDVEFLSKCNWPALSSLHLGSKVSAVPERGRVIDKLMEKFAYKLTSLRLTYSSIGRREHLLHCLPQLPALVQLYLEDGVVEKAIGRVLGHDDTEEEVIEALTPMVQGELFQHCCPSLQYLRWEGRTAFSDRSIINLLLQRAMFPQSSVAMKQVVINFDRVAEEDIADACTKLVSNGLCLKLTYSAPRSRDYELLPGALRDLRTEEDPLALGWSDD